MIIFDLDGTLANCEHRRHLVQLDIDFRPIVSHSNYYAGSDGHIYSFNSRGSKRTGIPIRMKAGKQKAGYLFVALYKNDQPTYCRVHVLICEAFHGTRPEGLIVSHLDDNKENNLPSNLIWETASENQKRKFINGHGDDGIRNSRALVKTKEQLDHIRWLISQGFSDQKIADSIGTSRGFVKSIRTGRSYKND